MLHGIRLFLMPERPVVFPYSFHKKMQSASYGKGKEKKMSFQMIWDTACQMVGFCVVVLALTYLGIYVWEMLLCGVVLCRREAGIYLRLLQTESRAGLRTNGPVIAAQKSVRDLISRAQEEKKSFREDPLSFGLFGAVVKLDREDRNTVDIDDEDKEEPKQEKRRIFFDMDGTLNVFESAKHLDEVSKPGYMKERTPIENMVEAARILSEQYEVWTASAVLPYNHSVPDKDYWLDKEMPFIPKDHRIYIPYGTDKGKALEPYIREGDIFIDDYSANLKSVSSYYKGKVSCIKCCNGINDTNHSWIGHRISIYSAPEVIADEIASV